MCAPQYLSTAIPNNVFMKQEKIDIPRAMTLWKRSVNVLKALDVDVLEIPAVKGCQDQTYVANVATAIEPFIVLANYKADGRPCETPPARKFFTNLGYNCIQPPFYQEGEADLKKWKSGVYFGGWGKFSDQRAYDWISKKTGAQIIPIHEVSDALYHLDCSLMVIDEENFLVTEAGMDKASLKTLGKLANIIITPPDVAPTGITNGVILPHKKIYMSGTFMPEEKSYRKAMEWLMVTMDKLGYSVILTDTDEFSKSGADLSCQVMHLDFEPNGPRGE